MNIPGFGLISCCSDPISKPSIFRGRYTGEPTPVSGCMTPRSSNPMGAVARESSASLNRCSDGWWRGPVNTGGVAVSVARPLPLHDIAGSPPDGFDSMNLDLFRRSPAPVALPAGSTGRGAAAIAPRLQGPG